MNVDFSQGAVAAESPRCEVPARIAQGSLGDFLPSFRDVIVPRLNVCQNIGEMKETFSPGEIVYAQTTVLHTPSRINAKTGAVENPGTKPVIVTFLGRVKERFAEKVSGGRGMIVSTLAEVRQAGGTLDYQEWALKKQDGMKRFEPLDDMLVAIERPETCKDDDTIFTFPANDKKYTFALWGMKGVIYTDCLKRVVYKDRQLGCLRGTFPNGGFPAHSYAISTREKVFENSNRAWTVNAIPHQKSTPEFLELVSSFVSGQ